MRLRVMVITQESHFISDAPFFWPSCFPLVAFEFSDVLLFSEGLAVDEFTTQHQTEPRVHSVLESCKLQKSVYYSSIQQN